MDHPITRSIGPCNTGNVSTIPRETSACRVDWVGRDSMQAETPEPPRPEGFCSRTVGFEPTTSRPLRRLNDEGSRLLMRKRHWAASSRPSRAEYHSPLPIRDHRCLNGHSNQERSCLPLPDISFSSTRRGLRLSPAIRAAFESDLTAPARGNPQAIRTCRVASVSWLRTELSSLSLLLPSPWDCSPPRPRSTPTPTTYRAGATLASSSKRWTHHSPFRSHPTEPAGACW